MKEDCTVDADVVKRLVELSEEIEHHPGISDEARAIVQAFLSLDADNNDRFQRYLYRQGAKDCVALLQELDLINALRRDAVPIASDKNGYYYAKTEQELLTTIHHMGCRISGIAAAERW